MAKKDSTFISRDTSILFQKSPSVMQKTKNYLNSKFPKAMWKLQNRIIAPVKNNKNFLRVRNYLLDLLLSSIIFMLVFWSFSLSHFIKRGFGTAILIASLQYYIVWYYNVKKEPPKRVIIDNEKLGVYVENNSFDVRMK